MSDGNLTPLDYTQIQILLERIENQNTPHSLNSSEYSKILREMIQNENDFTNERLGWMSTFNSILFGIIYFSWKEATNHTILIAGTCIAGFLVNSSIFISLIASEGVRQKLDRLWEKKEIPFSEIPPIWGGKMTKFRKYRYFMPWFVLPVVFLFCWVIIFFFHVRFKIIGD